MYRSCIHISFIFVYNHCAYTSTYTILVHQLFPVHRQGTLPLKYPAQSWRLIGDKALSTQPDHHLGDTMVPSLFQVLRCSDLDWGAESACARWPAIPFCEFSQLRGFQERGVFAWPVPMGPRRWRVERLLAISKTRHHLTTFHTTVIDLGDHLSTPDHLRHGPAR